MVEAHGHIEQFSQALLTLDSQKFNSVLNNPSYNVWELVTFTKNNSNIYTSFSRDRCFTSKRGYRSILLQLSGQRSKCYLDQDTISWPRCCQTAT